MVHIPQANWEAYTSDVVQELPHGHLVSYPVDVAPDGHLHSVAGHRCFPDSRAPVLGKTLWAPKCLRLGYVLTT